mgnify:CR=1 FL=1
MRDREKMKKLLHGSLYVIFTFSLLMNQLHGQANLSQPSDKETSNAPQLPLRLKFNNADLNVVIDAYSDVTGKTVLMAPGLPKVMITLKSQGELTKEEYLEAIEAVLAMHGISIIKIGDKFVKVVQANLARNEEMAIIESLPGEQAPDKAELVTQMIPLKNIEINDAQKVIKEIMHQYGKIIPLEKNNSILITDTAAVINRILQVIRYIDQPMEIPEETNVMVIRFAKASDIKKKLEEIIADSQKEAMKATVPRQKESGQPGVVPPQNIPGVIRATREPSQKTTETSTLAEQAERGIIVGKVKIIADDRTNLLIIITRPENMKFFDKIVKVLDVETEPDVIVKIFRLEYADAEQVASTINSLIGSKKADEIPAQAQGGGTGGTGQSKTGEQTADATRSQALREYVERLRESSGQVEKEKSKVGELSASNIKILSDKRTNSLLIMASKADLATLEEIIKSMDIMLSQVLIEAVIIQVDLDEKVQSGIQWVQRALLVQERDSLGNLANKGAIAGSGGGGRGTENFIPQPANTVTLNSLGSWAEGAGLNLYFTHFGLNLDGIVKILQSDNRTRILSAPVIVTTDNTKAKITASQQRYFLKGSTVDQFGNVRPETEIKDIGLTMTVTPHINKSGAVMMEIEQEISDEGPLQPIANQGSWPTTTKRSFTASIAVRDKETIILGGLVRKYIVKESQGIPVLSSIPVIGRLFGYKGDSQRNGEVVAFITPYVLDTQERIEEESTRRKEALKIGGLWEKGWSNSELAEDRGISSKKKNTGSWNADTSKADFTDGKKEVNKSEDPASVIDPEMRKFIQEQEKKFGESMKNIDAQINREMEKVK